MSNDVKNRAQRRREQREAKVHRPTFWDSMVNRIIVAVIAIGFLTVVGFYAFEKLTPAEAAKAPVVPVTPKPPTTPAAQTTPPPQPATPPDPNAKLKIDDVKVGTGVAAKSGDKVTVHYTGTLTNGTKFDSSRDKGQPLTFVIDGNAPPVIPGWNQGIAGMKTGGKRKLTIPPSLAYGATAKGKIPANSTLLFDIELLKIEPK